jgi:hypothetical protein
VTQVETSATTPETETVKGETYDAARAMATIEKLRAEIKDLKPKAKAAEELSAAEQKRKEAEMTELQKLQAELEKTKGELKLKQLADMKRAAAEKVQLPMVFADRLQGETPEELEADAKKILEALPKAPKAPAIGATNPGSGASQGETYDQQWARIHGQSVNPWDPNVHRQQGGGIFFATPEEGGKS